MKHQNKSDSGLETRAKTFTETVHEYAHEIRKKLALKEAMQGILPQTRPVRGFHRRMVRSRCTIRESQQTIRLDELNQCSRGVAPN